MSIGMIAYVGTIAVLAVVVTLLGLLSMGTEKESAKSFQH